MKISVSWLREKTACSEGIQWFEKQKETDGLCVLKALIKDDKLQWANWLICRVMGKPDQVRYAIYAAEQVLSIFEKKYPKDDRPRKAIKAAQAWLKNPNDNTKAAAYAAADAAYAAYAAYAADAAAYASYAAYAAAYAADAAIISAAAAAAADARKKLQLKILRYGMKLLRNGSGAERKKQ